MTAELAGLGVLIPRGGALGDRLAAAVSVRGGNAVIAPIIDFTEPTDARALADAVERLAAGEFDWLAVTSATTVDALVHHGVLVPDATRVAAVGAATKAALEAAGVPVDFVPQSAFSAEAMVAEWPAPRGSVLIPQSAIAEPTLADGLASLGLSVTAVAAYRTVTLDWGDEVTRRLNDGDFQAVLLTSASMARAVAAHWSTGASDTIVACIGQSTATAARAAGLPVAVVASDSTAEGLVSALGRHIASPTTTSPRT